jgi:hypothetical protein
MSKEHHEPRARAYPRGHSPFCSPKSGDVLKAANGDLRLVLSVSSLEGVSYASLRSECTHVATPEPIGRGAWAAWCSRTSAQLLTRDADAGFLLTVVVKRIKERETICPCCA